MIPCQRSVLQCPTPKLVSCLKTVTKSKSVEELAREVARVQGQPAGKEEDSEISAEVRTASVWATTPLFAHAGRSPLDVSRWTVGRITEAQSCEGIRSTVESSNRSWQVPQVVCPPGRKRQSQRRVAYANGCFVLRFQHHHGSRDQCPVGSAACASTSLTVLAATDRGTISPVLVDRDRSCRSWSIYQKQESAMGQFFWISAGFNRPTSFCPRSKQEIRRNASGISISLQQQNCSRLQPTLWVERLENAIAVLGETESSRSEEPPERVEQGTSSRSGASSGSPNRGVPVFHQAISDPVAKVGGRTRRRTVSTRCSSCTIESIEGRDLTYRPTLAATGESSSNHRARAHGRGSSVEISSCRIGVRTHDRCQCLLPNIPAAPNLSLMEWGAFHDQQVGRDRGSRMEALINQGSTMVSNSNRFSPLT